MKNYFKIVFSVIVFVGIFGLFFVAKADLSDTIGGKVGLESEIQTPIGTIIKGALALVGTIFLVLTVYAGILWMTAAGNESKTDSAKNILIAAVIGLAIVMTAYTITNYVSRQVGARVDSGAAQTSTSSAP